MSHFRSKIKSKKSVTIKLHATVMLNSFFWKIFFFFFSDSGRDMFSKLLKLSSLYKSMFYLPNSLVRRLIDKIQLIDENQRRCNYP